MTNGEMIKRMFPNETDFETDFDEDWWNAEYTGGFVEGLIDEVEQYGNRQGDAWDNSIVQGAIEIIKEYCGE